MSEILKPTNTIQKGLDEFGSETCLKALKLHEEKGMDATAVANMIIKPKKKGVSAKHIGNRMINTGRYLKYTFNQ